MRTLEQRFWAKVAIASEAECWEWQAARTPGGYGRFGGAYAHRVAMSLAGQDPAGFNVLHSCDNPPCVNPHHLRLGTQVENVADMCQRSHGNRGEAQGAAKLTSGAVLAIRARRAAGESGKVLAAEYGVSEQNVCNIVKRRTWRHLEEAS